MIILGWKKSRPLKRKCRKFSKFRSTKWLFLSTLHEWKVSAKINLWRGTIAIQLERNLSQHCGFTGLPFFCYYLGYWILDTKTNINKTGVINDPLGQTNSLTSSKHCFLLFCFAKFEKRERTDGQHVRHVWYLSAVTVGWPSGSI